MTKKATKAVSAVRVLMEAEVARQVRQHARSSMKAEVCGVLIGREENNVTVVDACIGGANAAQGGAHVTFTQDTWQHIYDVKDKKYPDARIVGWYHSHPGFGIFLSDHDLFIHQNFFSSPQQIAWVYDPHTDEEGCFGWLGEKIEKIDDVSFRFHEPCADTAAARSDSEGGDSDVPAVRAPKPRDDNFWMSILREAALAAAFLLIGGAAVFYYISSRAVLLPRDASGLLIVDQGQVAVVPPEVANQILGMLKAQMDSAMKSGQLSPSPAPPAQPGALHSGPQPGGQDVRKK